MSVRAAAVLAWALALGRIGGGAILLACLDAPGWAIAGWLLSNFTVRFRFAAGKGRST